MTEIHEVSGIEVPGLYTSDPRIAQVTGETAVRVLQTVTGKEGRGVQAVRNASRLSVGLHLAAMREWRQLTTAVDPATYQLHLTSITRLLFERADIDVDAETILRITDNER